MKNVIVGTCWSAQFFAVADVSIAQVKLVVGEDGELSIGDLESPTAPTAPPR